MTGLFEEFPAVPTAEWEAQIARALKGRDPKTLAWKTEDGIELKPFYRSEDLAGIEPRELFSSNDWKIGCEVSDAESARYAISRGATALYLESEADLSGVPLDGIELVWRRSPGLCSASPQHSPAQQLASALRRAPAALLELPIGPDYFIEIAKFRAARLLWPHARIIARTSKRNLTIYDPYVNLLRGTTEAMSAIIGGCDVLIVRPFDAAYENPGEFSRRLSINTQLILREESYFNRVPDPAAGCWYLEWLTDRLIEKARELSRGNAAPAPIERQNVFVGVNRYADPNERALERLTIAPDEDRDAWVFEKQRLEAERK
ncbi:MAG TPA: methylmalonyl-CoA mutase family protein [Candidatus Binataceae bacterium]|nr:methylmalonyl-CoA mutase family protein [Candidatus Binataceae bacterium]